MSGYLIHVRKVFHPFRILADLRPTGQAVPCVKSKLAEMTDEEAEGHVLSVLKRSGKMTTRELEQEVQRTGKRCPDSAVRFLMRLKTAGKVHGEVSVEKGGWLWWVDEGKEA